LSSLFVFVPFVFFLIPMHEFTNIDSSRISTGATTKTGNTARPAAAAALTAVSTRPAKPNSEKYLKLQFLGVH
jgi:hypothetical protein